MKKVERILCCSLLNHENLFDLDYKNVYSPQEPREFFHESSKLAHFSPVITHKGLVFTQMSCDEVLFVLVCKSQDISASEKIALMQFIRRLVKVCRDFMGTLNVDIVLSNITLLAEIIDCMLIGGYVHLTDTSKIKGFLSQSYTESKSPISKSLTASSTYSKLSGYQPPNRAKVVPVSQSINEGAKEEIYVDLIETLDYDINNTGETTCYIRGSISANNVSNGQKTVHFQLNKDYGKLIGQESFSRFVDSQRFSTHGLLQAGVPLGQTELMTYKLTSTKLPFTIVVLKGSSAGELIATLQCCVPASIMCQKVMVTFLLNQKPRGIQKLSKLASHTIELKDDRPAVEWNVPEIYGETFATAHFKVLPEGKVDYEVTSPLEVRLNFEISSYLHSGSRLQSLKVDNHKSVKKWIRHLSIAGECKAKIVLI